MDVKRMVGVVTLLRFGMQAFFSNQAKIIIRETEFVLLRDVFFASHKCVACDVIFSRPLGSLIAIWCCRG